MPFSDYAGGRLFYQLSGEHGPPLVFIHGMWGDHAQFAPQVEHFAPRHRVLVPDLAGHGQSGPGEIGMEGFAEQVAALCRHAGLKRVVAVGHSLGGAVAVSLAARHPELARGVVCLDTTLLAGEEAKTRFLPSLLARLETHPPVEALDAWLEPMFLPGDGPEIRQRVLEAVAAAPVPLSAGLIQAVMHWDGAAALAQAACPLLYVGGTTPRTPRQALLGVKPGALYGQVVGSGHFMTLVAPAQVNAMLERFLELLPAR